MYACNNLLWYNCMHGTYLPNSYCSMCISIGWDHTEVSPLQPSSPPSRKALLLQCLRTADIHKDLNEIDEKPKVEPSQSHSHPRSTPAMKTSTMALLAVLDAAVRRGNESREVD